MDSERFSPFILKDPYFLTTNAYWLIAFIWIRRGIFFIFNIPLIAIGINKNVEKHCSGATHPSAMSHTSLEYQQWKQSDDYYYYYRSDR
jgi:hypothetical protein